MSNKNKNQSEPMPKMETETVNMNLAENQSEPKETVVEMEARIRKETEAKFSREVNEQNERLVRLESSSSETKTTSQKSFSASDVNDLLEKMVREKDDLVAKLKGSKDDMVIDDTVSRAMNSTMISKNLKGKFNPSKGVANFMMRQNIRYAVEGKPEPYTMEALENTLKREMGVM